MEFVEHLERSLASFITILKLLLETIAAVCVLIGLIRTGQLLVAIRRRRNLKFPYLQVRLRFGAWLALALEFQLGADILNTTIAPTFEALTKLGAIAVIRTFLNYFLGKELEKSYELEEKAQHQSPLSMIL
ncbi:DUF1622 domain-containing protein [Fischerella sp. PCC 9605]|uniref:DUF1622 domain-containing protein n=1 Tax=Fischerella sp. PCC 9605 TaxID=1173024 RepID=UPI00047CD7C9|nr:DUF1622 domain-containing protein [Fischerella sp. PCC 9605]